MRRIRFTAASAASPVRQDAEDLLKRSLKGIRTDGWAKARRRTAPAALLAVALAVALAALAACGGGSDGGSTASPSTVGGSVFAAPVAGASVTVRDDRGTVVAGPVATAADGTFSVRIPVGAFPGPLRFESTGGTFDDEASGTPGVAAGRLAAYADAGSLGAGSAVHLTPASTIVHDLVAGGMTLAEANAAFLSAFGFLDNAAVAPRNDNAAGTSDAQKLAALRAMAFSQLTEDMPLPPGDQFALLSGLADDLSDGVLDGMDGGTPVSAESVPLREDIQNRFGDALARCFADTTFNRTGLTADKIEVLPFAKVALTDTYRIEYVPDPMMPAAQGKTPFRIRVERRSDNTAVTGLLSSGGFSLYPWMHMATRSHSSPVDDTMFTEGPDGTYNCTIYYLMSTMMGPMSMGFWELRVTIDGETATLYPFVGMPMGADTVRAILRGVNDNVASPTEPKRRYFLFKDGPLLTDASGRTIQLFLSAYDTMMSWPPVAPGTILHDASGADWPVNEVLVEASTDNATWIAGTPDGAHWTVAGLSGLTGPTDNVYVRLTVNGERKTTDGNPDSGPNGSIPFSVTP